ncbi:MAG TPA: M67 family metallopeptidase [Pyrinomonadaceae bacterium]|nr:M67 family metallopeptidase [Acidobacteriota bacterium]HQZ98339.1 M67 family metallopeptidase [Pyrinomonadaceae bacterium]
MLELQKGHLEAIKAHAEADYPHECGGLLLGHLDAENDKTVVETLPMENTAEVETRHDRVLIDPRALMLADRKAREKGLDVIGYYHSHPDDEAVPSQFDLDHALPVWSYIIVSVRDKKAVDWNSWEMENDRSKFKKEVVEIIEEVPE